MRRAVVAAGVFLALILGEAPARAQDLNEIYNEAVQLEKQGDFEGVLTRLRRILPLVSDAETRAKLRVFIGNTLVKQKKWDDARPDLEAGLSTVQDREVKARGLLSLGIVHNAKRDFGAAARTLREALQLSSDNSIKAAVGIELGVALQKACQFDEAERTLTQALNLATTPEHRGLALLNLAAGSEQQGRLAEAASRYQRAAADSTDDTKALALNNLSNVYLGQHRAREAYASAQLAMTTARSEEIRFLALQNKAAALWDQGRVREAKREFERIVAQSRSLEFAGAEFDAKASNMIGRAVVLSNIERNSIEARRLLEEALRIAHDTEVRASALKTIAPIYERDGRLEDALAAYREVERVSCNKETRSTAASGQGAVLRRLGRLPEAEAKLQLGLQLAPAPGHQISPLIQLFNIHVRQALPVILIVVVVIAGAGVAGYFRFLRQRGISIGLYDLLRRPSRQMAGGAAGALVGLVPMVVYDFFFINTTWLADLGFSRSLLHGFTWETITPEFLANRALHWFFVAALTVGVISVESWGTAGLRRRLLLAIAWAALSGGVGGLLLDVMVWLAIRDSVAQLTFAMLIAVTGLAMGLWGAFIGLGAGLTYGSRARIWRGAAGGMVGGLLGGLLFYPIYAVLLDVIPFDDPICITCVLRWVMLGGSIGFALGMIDLGFRWPLWQLNPVPIGAPRAGTVAPPVVPPGAGGQTGSLANSKPMAAPPAAGGNDWWSTTAGSASKTDPPAAPPNPQHDQAEVAKPKQSWWTDDAKS